jgi:plastocyanin
LTVRSRLVALGVAGGVLVFAPVAAQAKTKEVYMGTPPKYQKDFMKYGVDINDFFLHTVTINVNDTVSFEPSGFHTVDIPQKGGKSLALFSPTGQKIAGVTDAAGAPFWFNGQDQLGFTPALLKSAFGKKLTYSGKKRVESGLPLANKPKPVKVKFSKAGTFKYYCDVHPGMTGTIKVLKKGAKVPSSKEDEKAFKSQVALDLNRAKTLANTKPPANTIYAGASAKGGVEFFGMLPTTITVPRGTTLRTQLSPGSYDVHTVTFGPGDPQREPTSYLGQIAASFQGVAPDPKGLFPSEVPNITGVLSPALHGNGFWNSGVMDASSKTRVPGSNSITFNTPGPYSFYCLIHPFMHGTVIVT